MRSRSSDSYMETITLTNQDTYETCADYCTASDWTANEPCVSFGWNPNDSTCELYSLSEASAGNALETSSDLDFYE